MRRFNRHSTRRRNAQLAPSFGAILLTCAAAGLVPLAAFAMVDYPVTSFALVLGAASLALGWRAWKRRRSGTGGAAATIRRLVRSAGARWRDAGDAGAPDRRSSRW